MNLHQEVKKKNHIQEISVLFLKVHFMYWNSVALTKCWEKRTWSKYCSDNWLNNIHNKNIVRWHFKKLNKMCYSNPNYNFWHEIQKI